MKVFEENLCAAKMSYFILKNRRPLTGEPHISGNGSFNRPPIRDLPM